MLVKTRLAADAVGATPMDRPEWTSRRPQHRHGLPDADQQHGGGPRRNAANPRTPNPWGHIIRWDEDGGDHAATTFDWDLFLLAGQGRGTGDGSTIAAGGRLRLAGRAVDRPGQPGVDPDRRHPAGRRQRPDAGGRTRSAPTRPARRRSSGSSPGSGAARSPVSSPRRTSGRCSSTCSTPATAASTAGRGSTAFATAAVGDRRHHQGRRRGHRQLTRAARPGTAVTPSCRAASPVGGGVSRGAGCRSGGPVPGPARSRRPRSG